MGAAKARLLLLTGTPPGTAKVGEIILRDLVTHYGPSNVHCVAVLSPRYGWKPGHETEGLSVTLLPSIHVNGQRWGNGLLSAAGSMINFQFGFRREVSKLVRQIVAQARAARAEKIFAVLNNALIMAVAHRAAKILGLPMVTLVWDPPGYLCINSRFDRFSRLALMKEFEASLASSEAVAVVSETMQQDYAAMTRAPIHILRHGLPMDPNRGEQPNVKLNADEWIIGFAGSMYSDCAWKAFIKALDSVDWRIAGRPVRLKLLTPRIVLASRHAAQIDFLGFRPPDEAQAILEQCHLSYMPQPFVAHLRELCRYAFPTKLTNYLAIGRPVFIHAPSEGALSTFYDGNKIGARATSLQSASIVEALEGLLGDEQAYRDACEQVRKTARAHFDVSVFHRAIDRVLQPDTAQVAVA